MVAHAGVGRGDRCEQAGPGNHVPEVVSTPGSILDDLKNRVAVRRMLRFRSGSRL
jgi:hypothetical protein